MSSSSTGGGRLKLSAMLIVGSRDGGRKASWVRSMSSSSAGGGRLELPAWSLVGSGDGGRKASSES
eukprot:IDg4243t1